MSKRGKNEGQEKYKIDRSIPHDENDQIFINVGESYYWWQHMYREKQYSKSKPSRSQLTQSSFFATLYDLEDKLQEFYCETKDDFDEFKESICDEIQELIDQCQESKDNMPEHLQDVGSGEILKERIDALENWKSEIDGVDCEDYDEEQLMEEIRENNPDANEDDLSEILQEHIQEFIDTAIGEIKETSAGL